MIAPYITVIEHPPVVPDSAQTEQIPMEIPPAEEAPPPVPFESLTKRQRVEAIVKKFPNLY